MSAYYEDDTVTLHHGDALAVLREMPDASVDCCVTSPPYLGLRDYGVDGQIGAEKSPAEYVERLRELFAEVRRVLADDGTLWLNLGDSYSSGGRGTYDIEGGKTRARGHLKSRPGSDLPDKNLIGIPWRTAFALQDGGWILRNSIIWHKPNAMPESVTDRLSNRHENLFMFSKSRRYWFDLDPIREKYVPQTGMANSFARDTKDADVPGPGYGQHRQDRSDPTALGKRPDRIGMQPQAIEFGGVHNSVHVAGKNPGDVWEIATTPFPGAHFAAYPPELVRRCIVSGCKPGGTVLDPFSGSGTTGMVAQKHGRKYIGIDLNAEYLDLSLRTRLANTAMEFPA